MWRVPTCEEREAPPAHVDVACVDRRWRVGALGHPGLLHAIARCEIICVLVGPSSLLLFRQDIIFIRVVLVTRHSINSTEFRT